MKVLVTGSRKWTDTETIAEAIGLVILEHAGKRPHPVLIHGAAHGADVIAAEIARAARWTVRSYAADWKLYGASAGPIRNGVMLIREHVPAEPVDLCLAFPLADSIGTWNMVNRCKRATPKIEIRLYHPRGTGK